MRDTNGDILEQLYREHRQRIYLFVFSVCKNKEAAEDITQDTFVKAFTVLPDQNKNALQWLYTVADRLTMDWFRDNRRFSGLPEDENEPNGELSAAERVITDERHRQLYAAIAALPEIDRKIITLFYFSGLSQREIASVTGLSFVNVRVRMARAREKLKELLTEE